jgi:threonine/homoserine/homoserine lactone efflux protein
MNIENYFYFLTICLVINLTPGPGMVYVVTQTMSKGRASGICSAIGLEVGCLFHVLLVVFGVTSVFVRYPSALLGLQWAGAIYLLYLAFDEFKTAFKKKKYGIESKNILNSGESLSLWDIFKKGVVVDVLNPKVALFILAFIPQFITADSVDEFLPILLLGLTFSITGTFIHILIALFSDKIKGVLFSRQSSGIYTNIVPGIIFAFLATFGLMSSNIT